MLDRLKRLLTVTPTVAEEAPSVDVAFAALLVEAARIDGDYAPEEKALIGRIVAAEFDLDDAAAAACVAEAEELQDKAVDHYRFSRVVKEGLSHEEKVGFVERLWEVVLSDGVRDQYEDYLVRRLLGLLHVSDKESGEARLRVEARRKT